MLKRLILSFVACLSFGAEPQFEAASVRLAEPMGPGSRIAATGGPGTADPTLFSCENCTVQMLVQDAFEVPSYATIVPSSVDSEHYQILARVPKGTSKADFRLMLQRLLRDSFRMIFHSEQRKLTGYLLKASPRGSKLVPSPAQPVEDQATAPGSPGREEPPQVRLGKDGFPILPSGGGFMLASMGDRYRLRATHFDMASFAQRLSNQLHAPVADSTGLEGYYDVDLVWALDQLSTSVSSADTGETIFEALRSQLGLILEGGKVEVPMFIVDHVERIPIKD